jgi:DedD protein
MRTVFEDEDEEVTERYQEPDRELTLSSTTLLAIFFGLVLVCGLFFGLGYTLGRRTSSDAAAVTPPETSSPIQSTESGPKPSATAIQPRAEAAAPPPLDTPPAEAQTSSPAESSEEEKAPQPPAHVQAASLPVATQAAPAQTPTVKPALHSDAMPATAQPAVAATGTVMVQIAAVSSTSDATVLVNALRKRGYAVVVRQQPSDSLQHVQVGPFASRADANVMKQKLIADGYNAILK